MPKTKPRANGTVRMTSGNRISLPAGLFPEGVREFSFELQKDGSILLVPLFAIPASQRYFWTRRWQEGEREADRAAASGKTIRYKNVEALLKKIGE